MHNVYLISGGYDVEKRAVVERSAAPIGSAFFSRLSHKEHTLTTTDDYGAVATLVLQSRP